MDMPEHELSPAEEMLAQLKDIRDRLEQTNEALGYAERVRAIKREILQVGWDGILARYHPDVSIDDPAAGPLFELYRFVYNTMKSS